MLRPHRPRRFLSTSSLSALVLAGIGACSGSAAPQRTTTAANERAKPTTDAASASKNADASANDGPIAIPTACADSGSGGLCVPPAKFVKKLCEGFFPDVALSMFGKSTPWTRAYLRGDVDAWYASGGAASSDKLVFNEEVIILIHREADKGGIQVSGSSGGYDVLRWNGTCASLMRDEVTRRHPPNAKNAKIPWKNLDNAVREALLADVKIGKVYADRNKECKGVTVGGGSSKCTKLDDNLSVAVVEYIRNGGSVPTPDRLP